MKSSFLAIRKKKPKGTIIKKSKSNLNKSEFQILTEAESVMKRPEVLLGPVKRQDKIFHLYSEKIKAFEAKNFSFSTGFFKLFDEVVTNAVDVWERNNKSLKTIKINVTDEYIECIDDGSGFEQKKIKHEGKTFYDVQWAFSKISAGSNFSDKSRTTVGLNGVGASLLSFLSSLCEVKTRKKGSQVYNQTFSNHGSKISKPKFTARGILGKSGTSVKLYPDMSAFKLPNTLLREYLPLYREHIRILSMLYPTIKFVFNGEKISFSQKDFINGWLDQEIIFKEESKGYSIAFGLSETPKNFYTVNSKEITAYTEFETLKISIFNELRAKLNKKYKLNVARNSWFYDNVSIIGMFRGLNVRFEGGNSKDVLYSVDTEKISETTIQKITQKLFTNKTLIDDFLDFHQSKDLSTAKKDLKKLSKKFIAKMVEASGKRWQDKILIITEGQSAQGAFSQVRDPKVHSLLPLKGKTPNVTNMTITDVLKNEEYQNIISAMGLEDGTKSLKHSKLYIATDQDCDGLHIRILLINFFAKFFPEMIIENRLFVLESPLYEYTLKGKVCYSYKDTPPKSAKNISYFKGLGSNSKSANEEIMNNPKLIPVVNIKEINKVLKRIYPK